MRYGSLFSGIGGFDAGFDAAGMTCAWQVEQDANCLRVLNRHWPRAPKLNDVRLVNEETVEPVDLICGGFPCQDLSVAGRRAGLAGERSGLWFEFHRILAGLKPRWVVIENVPGLLSGCGCFSCQAVGRLIRTHARIRRRKGGKTCAVCVAGKRMLESHSGRNLTIILRGLVQLGYGVCWRILDAQYFGVAQRRRRVFIVGSLGNGRSAEVLFERESLLGNPAESRAQGQRVADSLTVGANQCGGFPGDFDEVAATLNSGGNSGGFRTEPGAHQVSASVSSKWAKGTGGPSGDEVLHLIASSLQSGEGIRGGRGDGADNQIIGAPVAFAQNTRDEANLISGDGAIAGALGAEPGMKQQNYIAFTSKDDGRDCSEISPTLRSMNHNKSHINGGGQVAIAVKIDNTKSNGRGILEDGTAQSMGGSTDAVTQGFGVRRLTPTECERLQGFADGHTAGESDSARYRMLGNAVARPVAEWIGRQIMRVEATR